MLPIGTVVGVKGNEHILMIIGLNLTNSDNNTLYEYTACKYPVGILGNDEYVQFNKADVENIYHVGFTSKNHNEYVEISKAVNHCGEYANMDYDLETYADFLRIKREEKQTETQNKQNYGTDTKDFVEL